MAVNVIRSSEHTERTGRPVCAGCERSGLHVIIVDLNSWRWWLCLACALKLSAKIEEVV